MSDAGRIAQPDRLRQGISRDACHAGAPTGPVAAIARLKPLGPGAARGEARLVSHPRGRLQLSLEASRLEAAERAPAVLTLDGITLLSTRVRRGALSVLVTLKPEKLPDRLVGASLALIISGRARLVGVVRPQLE